MLNEQGPFSKCLNKIPGEGHHKSCVYDVCSNTGHVTLMKQLACDALSVMAKECKAVGATPEGWQQIAGCGIVVFNNFHLFTFWIHFGVFSSQNVLSFCRICKNNDTFQNNAQDNNKTFFTG